MRHLMMAVILAALSGCGMYPHGSTDSSSTQQSQTPMTGNGNGGGGGGY